MKNHLDTHDAGVDVWQSKYRYPGNERISGDSSLEDTWDRIAKAVSANEASSGQWRKRFLDILTDFKFLPAGRIIANAGTARRQSTMFNCYVMGDIPDSIEGIFDTVKESALTQKQGGGVGFDFSSLRPEGASIKGCEAHSSGPLSFMRVLDSTCRTIMSAGQRRGAQMGVMRCDHPDIEKFITAKRNNADLRMFNLSVAVTDKFIEAVRGNQEWELCFNGEVHKTTHAVQLWELMMKSTYDFAEPGFILIDRVNQMNNLHYCETIRATNPCAEQPLPPYGACLLGSVNLTKFVKNPFTRNASVDLSGIESVVRTAVRFLDNVIDISGFPLEAQRQEASAKRRMGIGVTGLANLFYFMGVRYGSPKSLELAESIMSVVTSTAYETSVALGREKGVFPMFDGKRYPEGRFIKTLPKSIQRDIRKNGLRNSHLTSIAPTGTISLLAGNVSSGLEPVFALKFKRKFRQGAGDDVVEKDVTDYAYRAYLKKHGGKTPRKLPNYFVTTDDITPMEHLNIQAALQKHVDSSISKTINVPKDFPFDQFEGIYMRACELGLKGCATFRPSDQITGILTKKEEDGADSGKLELSTGSSPPKVKRPSELHGATYKIRTPLSAESLYVTINDLEEKSGGKRPYELFINTKNLQHYSWIVAVTRLVSAIFRRDPKPSFLVEELKNIYDPNGGYFQKGKYIPSLVADIGRILEIHLNKIGIMKTLDPEETLSEQTNDQAPPPPPNSNAMFCPQCGERSMIMQENCLKCLGCGFSKCG